ncbi:MAG TPA: PEP-CTERM sorting domain-containing protein [Terracidiphilus sp.]|nr:PEP-CTERM sorting domain-containing protein [Terracidiphilus sp.]
MKLRISILFLTLVCLVISAPAFAGVIFDDGPTDGFDNGFFIDGPNPGPWNQSISNGFVATGGGEAYALDFGVWVPSGSTLTTITWWLGTSAFAGDLGTGTVTNFTSDFMFSNSFGYDIYEIHITGMNGGTLSAGNMYWLTLGNANDSFGEQFDGWDVTNGGLGGPAICNFMQGGVNWGDCGAGGEAFTLYSKGQVPEPGSLLLLGSGLLGLAGLLRRKM